MDGFGGDPSLSKGHSDSWQVGGIVDFGGGVGDAVEVGAYAYVIGADYGEHVEDVVDEGCEWGAGRGGRRSRGPE